MEQSRSGDRPAPKGVQITSNLLFVTVGVLIALLNLAYLYDGWQKRIAERESLPGRVDKLERDMGSLTARLTTLEGSVGKLIVVFEHFSKTADDKLDDIGEGMRDANRSIATFQTAILELNAEDGRLRAERIQTDIRLDKEEKKREELQQAVAEAAAAKGTK